MPEAVLGWFLIIVTLCVSGSGAVSIDADPYPTVRQWTDALKRDVTAPQNDRCTAVVSCQFGRRLSKMKKQGTQQ